ncbi:hypothetical protein DPMN_159055 [Dreissena polymorpha]|uniref:Uncharacterized protein n=1 Tax=Dreissena polymorpha TaxID=45954 RepID=A0A9D4EKV9_DREPO|nr:hypothetical protein DPMN_159055 [Dreissena polymorpha]
MAIAVVHSVFNFPITPAVLTHCLRDLSRWKHLQITVIAHADKKTSTVGLIFWQKSR